jgi:hypothetical protein
MYDKEYYKQHKNQYLASSKEYYHDNKQKFKDRYKKSIGCKMEKPFFSITHFPEGVNPFEKDWMNPTMSHR